MKRFIHILLLAAILLLPLAASAQPKSGGLKIPPKKTTTTKPAPKAKTGGKKRNVTKSTGSAANSSKSSHNSLQSKQKEQQRQRELKAQRQEQQRQRELEAQRQEQQRQRELEAQRQEQQRQRELEAQRQEQQRQRELEAQRREQQRQRELEAQRQDPQRVIQNLIANMVYVEGGTFTMGATSEQGSDAFSDEKPTHQVTLSSFSIGKYEVTQAEWQAVMGNNPSHFTGDSRRPVESVSWNDCQEFVRKLNAMTGKRFRLPTEAEWEFAARGGNRSRGYKYAGSNTLGNVAWYDNNNDSKTHPVGTKSPNELGLYDMSGNVWEWCNDWLDSYSSNSQYNPIGPASGSSRVYRGGGWNNYAGSCRVSYRCVSAPGYRDFSLGLRLVL